MSRELIIIPVYNEERLIGPVIDDIRKTGAWDILVVEDGSTDGSLAVVSSFPGVRVLQHPRQLGYGRSLMDGFSYAMAGEYEVALTIDGDQQHETRFIPAFFEHICDSDIVSGSRYMAASPVRDDAPRARRAVNLAITGYLNALTGYSLTDAFCGYKAYRVDALRKLRLTETGYGFPLQVWIQAWAHRLTVRELPVSLIYLDGRNNFVAELSDPVVRYRYYMDVILEEFSRCLKSSR